MGATNQANKNWEWFQVMSSAFTKDVDEGGVLPDVGERPVSTARNLVTRQGMAMIDAEIAFAHESMAKAEAVAGQYMGSILFLVIGGAMLGVAMEKWGLHRRIAVARIRDHDRARDRVGGA